MAVVTGRSRSRSFQTPLDDMDTTGKAGQETAVSKSSKRNLQAFYTHDNRRDRVRSAVTGLGTIAALFDGLRMIQIDESATRGQ
jgi:hypothetical protein